MTRKVSTNQIVECRSGDFIFSFAVAEGEIFPHVTFGYFPEPLGNVRPQTVTLKADPRVVYSSLRALLEETSAAISDAVSGELSVHISESVPTT